MITLLIEPCIAHADAVRAASRVLTHGDFAVAVMEPNHPERYSRGVRFTPVAAIISARLGKNEFLYHEAKPDPLTAVAGLFAEFDLETAPPGFAEAKLGEGYVKIGVGVLKKDAPNYQFWPQHEVLRRAETTVQWGVDTAQFRQVCAPHNGYGYALVADVTVGDGTIVVDWRLQNTGTKPFTTQQYTHNCFQFNQQPVGPDYTVTFPYDFTARGLQPEQRQEGRTIRFEAPIPKAVNIRVAYPPDYAGPNTLTARHSPSGLMAECLTSLPGAYTAVHAAKIYLCPEQFVTLRLAPGASATWQRRYKFAVKQ